MEGVNMRRLFSKYLFLLLMPLGIIRGKARQIQIQKYQASSGKPTMTGVFAFLGHSLLGIYSGIALFLIALIHSTKKLTRKEKDIFILIIMLLSIPMLIFITLFLGF